MNLTAIGYSKNLRYYTFGHGGYFSPQRYFSLSLPVEWSGRSGNLCQVFVRLTAEGVEIATTPTACQAQALCEGKVELDGQRFTHATRLAPGTPGPCFEKRPAP